MIYNIVQSIHNIYRQNLYSSWMRSKAGCWKILLTLFNAIEHLKAINIVYVVQLYQRNTALSQISYLKLPLKKGLLPCWETFLKKQF